MTLSSETRHCPVGALDSGLGGLSVLKEVRRLLPAEDLVFACDCGMAPWGDRSDDWIRTRVNHIADYLLSRKCKALVIACNTATAVAVEQLRARVNVPVIGIEPAVKPAVKISRSGVVGVIATTKTIRSPRLRRLIEKFSFGEKVVTMPCPGLMEKVEAGAFGSPDTVEMLHRYIDPLLSQGADTLVLGCTHYPFLIQAIRQITGDDVRIIDPSPAVARRLQSQLEEFGLLEQEQRTGTEEFWCTGDTSTPGAVLAKLWGPNTQMRPLEQAWPVLSQDRTR